VDQADKTAPPRPGLHVTGGFLFDKFKDYGFLLLSVIVFIMGGGQALLTSAEYVWLLFVDVFLVGVMFGALHGACNLVCIRTWRGCDWDGAPFRHSMHCFFALGLFISPLLSKPFLTEKQRHPGMLFNETSQESVSSVTNKTSDDGNELMVESSIALLYPLVGLGTLAVSSGLLALGIREIFAKRATNRRRRQNADRKEQTEALKQEVIAPAQDPRDFEETLSRRRLMLGFMVLFFFFYGCLEFTTISFLPTFGVKSALALSTSEAAELMAYYLGPLLVMRILAIFLSLKLRPKHILGMNVTLCLTGAVTNVIVSDSSLLASKIAFGMIGAGTSSMFGNSMMFMEGFLKVDGKKASLLSGGACLGILMGPIVMGQTMNSDPTSLLYLMLVCIVCFSTFGLCAGAVGVSITRMRSEIEERRNVEMDHLGGNNVKGEAKISTAAEEC